MENRERIISFNTKVDVRIISRYLNGSKNNEDTESNALWGGWDYNSTSEEFSSANFITEYQVNTQNNQPNLLEIENQYQTMIQESDLHQNQNNNTNMGDYEEDQEVFVGAFILEEGHK